MMSRVLVMLFSCLFYLPSFSRANSDDFHSESEGANVWGFKKVKSNFHLGVDLQIKYVWRGMEMMVEDAAPVLFPQINYQYKGLYLYVMGGYSINGKYAEVDLGASYTWKWLTIGLNDYYYPSTNAAEDDYFSLGNDNTGHWIEGVITVAPERIPLYLTVSNFFYGADKNAEGEQAYSTYVEVGSYYDFLEDHRISMAIGAACNESCYNNYEHDFGICNLELKYTYNLSLKNDWTLPLNVAYILNPVREKSFVNFTTSFVF